MPLENPAAPGAPAAPVATSAPAAGAPPASPPVAAHVEPAPAPAIPVATPAPDTTIRVPQDMYEKMLAAQSALGRIEAERQQAEQEGKRQQAKIMAEKGEIENALKLLRDQSEQETARIRAEKDAIETRAKKYALDGELSRVLASHPLVPGGAQQLTDLWRGQFEVSQQGESFRVNTPTLQSVSDFVTAQLGKPEYDHFVRAKTSGGTAAPTTVSQTTPTAQAPEQAPAAPATAMEAILQGFKASGANKDGHLAASRTAAGRPAEMPSFGLRRSG